MSALARHLLQITTAARVGWAVAAIIESGMELIQFLPKFKLWIKLFRVSIMSDTKASSALTGWWIHSGVSCQAKQWSDLFRSKSWSFYVNSTIIVFAIIRRRFGQFGKIHPRRTVWHWLIREKSQPDLFSFFLFLFYFLSCFSLFLSPPGD